MDEILRALGLSMQELPESIRVYIKAVSSVATTLGISDSELTRCEEGFIYYLKISLLKYQTASILQFEIF